MRLSYFSISLVASYRAKYNPTVSFSFAKIKNIIPLKWCHFVHCQKYNAMFWYQWYSQSWYIMIFIFEIFFQYKTTHAYKCLTKKFSTYDPCLLRPPNAQILAPPLEGMHMSPGEKETAINQNSMPRGKLLHAFIDWKCCTSWTHFLYLLSVNALHGWYSAKCLNDRMHMSPTVKGMERERISSWYSRV